MLCSVYRTFNVFCERFEVVMYNKVFRCFKTTGSEHSVSTILSGWRDEMYLMG